MTQDTLKMGPNYASYTVNAAPTNTYRIPNDCSYIDVTMKSCGGGGGGGAQAIYDGVFVDRDEYTGGGGGSAGSIARVEIEGYIPLYQLYDPDNPSSILLFDPKGCRLTQGSLGKRGDAGTWGYAHAGVAESGGVARVSGGPGGNADDVYFRLENDSGEWIQILLTAGRGGSGGYAHAELSGGDTTPGAGASPSQYLVIISYYSQSVGANTIWTLTASNSSSNMGVQAGMTFWNNTNITNGSDVIGSISVSNNYATLRYDYGGKSGYLNISWTPGYSRSGSSGYGATGGAGGIYSGGASGGRGGNGKEQGGGEIGGTGSYIDMKINRNNPYVNIITSIDPSSQTVTYTRSKNIRVQYNGTLHHASDIKYYNGNDWVRINGNEYHYDSGSYN